MTELIGHLDNQNGILSKQTDQHDQGNLCIDVVFKSGQLQEEIRAENTRRQRKDDGQGQQQILILGSQQQINKQKTDTEDQECLSAGIFFFTRNT